MELAKQEKRRFYRHPLEVPIEVQTPKEKAPTASQSVDVSKAGMRFLWNWKLPKGNVVNIVVPVKKKRFKLKAEVAYSEEDTKTWRFLTGVSFLSFPDDFKAALSEQLLEILEHREKLSNELGYQVNARQAASEWLKRVEFEG